MKESAVLVVDELAYQLKFHPPTRSLGTQKIGCLLAGSNEMAALFGSSAATATESGIRANAANRVANKMAVIRVFIYLFP